MQRIAVLGAGSWGTALAVHLASCGHDVRLWARSPALAADLERRRANVVYLADVMLPAGVTPTPALPEALESASLAIVAVPSHGLRSVMRSVASVLAPSTVVVSATKGLEVDTLQRMSEVIGGELGADHPVVVLSGPSFAYEVARGRPTAVCVASTNATSVALVQHEFRSRSLRLYATDDVVGVEIGGALKNVIAIAAGVVESLGLGHNALAALITRGLAEISRLACTAGGRPETLAGLSGLGDLILTCTGHHSRNRHLGMELGRGRPLDEILAGMKMVAEGVNSARAALLLGERLGVELPIAAQMHAVLAGRKAPGEAAEELMLRRQRSEPEGR